MLFTSVLLELPTARFLFRESWLRPSTDHCWTFRTSFYVRKIISESINRTPSPTKTTPKMRRTRSGKRGVLQGIVDKSCFVLARGADWSQNAYVRALERLVLRAIKDPAVAF